MPTQMPVANFPGIRRPSLDFQDVRDGRRSTPFYVDVDLSTARSIAAGTQLVLPIAGNSFYADPVVDSSGNAIGGVAVVHFQDTTLNPQGTPFTVYSQFIAQVPFTQVLIENPAQTGKRLRIIYGVDVDFRPGINAQVNITNTVTTTSGGQAYGAKFSSTTALAAGATENIFAVGANANGVIVHDGFVFCGNGTTDLGSITALHAHTAAPAAWTDGDILIRPFDQITVNGASFRQAGKMATPLLMPANKGLWFRNHGSQLEILAVRHVLYTVK